MPRRRPTIRQWMHEYNRLATLAQARGLNIRTLVNLRVSNDEAHRRVSELAQRLQTTSALVDAAGPVAPLVAGVVTSTRLPSGTSIDDFTFGVEIEFVISHGITQMELARRLNAVVPCQAEVYNHQTRSHWKIVTDGSLRPGPGQHGLEAVSPRLRGLAGLEQVAKICDALTEAGAVVNRSCGFHVHIGVKAEVDNAEFMKRLIAYYEENEHHIDSIVAPSRRGALNAYCQPFSIHDKMRIAAATTVTQIVGPMDRVNRFRKLNLQAYWRHRTLENRQHQGTTDKTKACAWVRLNLRMFAASAKAIPPARATNLLDFLAAIECNADEVGYFASRFSHFHGGGSSQE